MLGPRQRITLLAEEDSHARSAELQKPHPLRSAVSLLRPAMLLLNLIFSISATVHHWPRHAHTHLWWIVMSVVFFVMAGIARGATLSVQDRIIRLEERLRSPRCSPPTTAPTSTNSRSSQIIALRFASDAELPALVPTHLTENLDPKRSSKPSPTGAPTTIRV